MDNITVRHCTIAGFQKGAFIVNGDGHVIEDNLVRNSREAGIELLASNSVVRRNRVIDIVDVTNTVSELSGIRASANVIDNTVANVGNASQPLVYGIEASGHGNQVRGNRVRLNLAAGGMGIAAHNHGMVVSDNHVTGAGQEYGLFSGGPNTCTGNTVSGFDSNYVGTCPGLDNL